MTTRRFIVQAEANPQLLREEPRALDIITESLRRKAADLRGPRGGRYVPVGDIYDVRVSQDHADYFIRNRVAVAAYVDARYVRPKRALG